MSELTLIWTNERKRTKEDFAAMNPPVVTGLRPSYGNVVCMYVCICVFVWISSKRSLDVISFDSVIV